MNKYIKIHSKSWCVEFVLKIGHDKWIFSDNVLEAFINIQQGSYQTLILYEYIITKKIRYFLEIKNWIRILTLKRKDHKEGNGRRVNIRMKITD